MSSKADRRFYASPAWRRLRSLKFANDPICEVCAKKGIVEPAVEVDHKVARVSRPDLELDYDNLQSICKQCHTAKTNREGRSSRKSKVKNLKYNIENFKDFTQGGVVEKTESGL